MEIIPSTPNASASPDSPNSWSDAAQPPGLPEQFDAVMERTLARSPGEVSEDPDPSAQLPSAKDKQQKRAADSGNAPPMPGAENAAAQLAPPAVPPVENSPPRTGTNPRVEVVSNPGQTATPPAITAKNSAAAGSSLSGNDAADDAVSLAQKLQPSTTESSAPGASGLKDPLEKNPVAGGEQTAGSECSLIALPTAAGKTASGTQPADGTGSLAGTGTLANTGLNSAGSVDPAGISSAQHQLAMQKAEKTNELSASAQQNLPVAPAGVAGEELPAAITRTVNSLSRQEKSELTSATDSPVTGVASPSETVSSASHASPPAPEAPLRSLERANDLMSLHASRLRDSGADSLQVVIKPGPGMQLSLNLQMRDGSVEMHATLDRGDFDFLSRQWSELQQQLESHGVRLAPLASGAQNSGGNQNLFQQADRQKENQDTAQPGAFAAVALATASKPAVTTQTTKTLRGWESWA